jgi:hypothetical protein
MWPLYPHGTIVLFNYYLLPVSAWKKFCIPKGTGLGLRDLYILNETLITDLTWRMLNEPETLCAQVLKGKYFSISSFWRVSSHVSKLDPTCYNLKIQR